MRDWKEIEIVFIWYITYEWWIKQIYNIMYTKCIQNNFKFFFSVSYEFSNITVIFVSWLHHAKSTWSFSTQTMSLRAFDWALDIWQIVERYFYLTKTTYKGFQDNVLRFTWNSSNFNAFVGWSSEWIITFNYIKLMNVLNFNIRHQFKFITRHFDKRNTSFHLNYSNVLRSKKSYLQLTWTKITFEIPNFNWQYISAQRYPTRILCTPV